MNPEVTSEVQEQLSQIPQVDRLIQMPQVQPWRHIQPSAQRNLAQDLLRSLRNDIKHGLPCPPIDEIASSLATRFETHFKKGVRRAVNATGIVLHTNLGRAPLGKELLNEMAQELHGYCTLEVEEETGLRGKRGSHAQQSLALLFGCEASALVNNNAAAVFLVLQALASGKEVLLSRGEIVQIGGGFRVPDILSASGAKLVEVGTTNITRASDYSNQATASTAMILKVHQSNFVIEGHTEAPSLHRLSEIAKKLGVPFVVDLGSGSLEDRLGGETSIQRTLAGEPDVICFSGDKLFGASQAGIILGRAEYIRKIKSSPLYRALRLGKLDLFLLERTLELHLTQVPTATETLLAISVVELESRANALSQRLSALGISSQVVKAEAKIGGGTTPQEVLETYLIEVSVPDAQKASERLCQFDPPIFVRKSTGKIAIDLRTVFLEDEEVLVKGVACLS